jgi:hypothetical protein
MPIFFNGCVYQASDLLLVRYAAFHGVDAAQNARISSVAFGLLANPVRSFILLGSALGWM